MQSSHNGSILLIVIIVTAIFSLFIVQSWRITNSVSTASYAMLTQTTLRFLAEDLLYYAIAQYSSYPVVKQKRAFGYTLQWPLEQSHNHISLEKTYKAKILYQPTKNNCTIHVGLYQKKALIIAGTATITNSPYPVIESWHMYH